MSWILDQASVPVWLLLWLFGGTVGLATVQMRAERFRRAYRDRTGADLPTVPEDLSGRGLAEVLLMLMQFAILVALAVGLAGAVCDRVKVGLHREGTGRKYPAPEPSHSSTGHRNGAQGPRCSDGYVVMGTLRR